MFNYCNFAIRNSIIAFDRLFKIIAYYVFISERDTFALKQRYI